MWIGIADRKILLDIVSTKNPSSVIELHSAINMHEYHHYRNQLILVWEEKPEFGTVLPDVICLEENLVQDFLAWVSTYLPLFRPFTSYCRILDFTTIDFYMTHQNNAGFKNLEGPVIGAIIGETLSHYENQDIKRITPTSIMNTYSFVMANACAHGIINHKSNPLRERWEKCYKLTNQYQRKLRIEEIERVWDVLILLSEDNDKSYKNYNQDKVTDSIFRACKYLMLYA
jgi:hypothetical protein